MALTAFSTLGVLLILLAVFIITRRNPVTAAVLLICDFVVLAAMYALMDAHFAAVTQIIVYAGAILVVFVFIIMMLNIPIKSIRFGHITWFEWLLAFCGLTAAFAFSHLGIRGNFGPYPNHNFSGLLYDPSENMRNVAASMFADYLWAFELSGIILTTAIIAAVVVAKKRRGA